MPLPGRILSSNPPARQYRGPHTPIRAGLKDPASLVYDMALRVLQHSAVLVFQLKVFGYPGQIQIAERPGEFRREPTTSDDGL